MSSEREQIVRVLKQYPGITAKMDLSENSALVIDLAAQLQAAKAEARNEHYKAALLQMKRWANLHEVIGNDTISDYVDHVVESLDQSPEQQLPTLAELEAPPKETEVSHE